MGFCRSATTARAITEHDPEKWIPVFPRDKREAFARRSCSIKQMRRTRHATESERCTMGTISTTWSDERVVLLRALFERGCTCREMAYEIGVSRNAVIGKLARLGLVRGTGHRVPRERRTGPAAPRPRGARQLQILLKAHVEDGD